MGEIKYRKAEEMKDSGVEWLGEIPKMWTIKKLKQICNVKNGTTPMTSIIQYWDGDINWFTPTDFSGKYLKSSTRTITKRGFNSCGTNLVFKGSILITCRAPIGNLGIIESENASYNQGCKAVIPDNNIINKYIYYVLLAGNHFIQGRGKGTTFMELSSYDLNNLQFAIQNIDEQQKIANFLEIKTTQFDSIISKKEQLIQKLEEAKKSLISEVVTGKVKIVEGELVKRQPEEMKDSGVEWLGLIPKNWKTNKLKYYMSVRGGGAFKSEDFTGEGIQLIRIGNLYQNTLDLERQPVFLRKEYLKNSKDFVVKKGDILISLTGTMGKRDYGYAILIEDDSKFLLNQRVGKLTCNVSLIKEYALTLLRSEEYLNQLFSLPAGTKQANLSNHDVLKPTLPFPEIEDQIIMVNSLRIQEDSFEKIITKTNLQIQKLKQAKQSLISEAVTGKIDLRDWQIIEEMS